jgi:hypothetical protein
MAFFSDDVREKEASPEGDQISFELTLDGVKQFPLELIFARCPSVESFSCAESELKFN